MSSFYLFNILWRMETASRVQGEWITARDFSDRGLAVSPMDPRLLLTRAWLEFEVGDYARGEAHMERAVPARASES